MGLENPIQLSSVLAVEQKADNRLIMQGVIEPLGVALVNDIHFVANGIEAKTLLETGTLHPNAIIVDIDSPAQEEDFDFLRYIKAEKSPYKQTPVIVLSTNTHPETEEICRELGAEYFISTPDLFKKLQGTVRYVFFGKDEK